MNKAQTDAWRTATEALRMHFIDGNSQIPNIDEKITQWTIDLLDSIRHTDTIHQTDTIVRLTIK